MSTNTPKILHNNQECSSILRLAYKSDQWFAFYFKIHPEEKSLPSRQLFCCIRGSPSLEQGKWQLFSCSGQFHMLCLGIRQSLFQGEVPITSLPAASSLHLLSVECICYQTWSFTNHADKSQRKQPFCKPISCTTVEPCRQKCICWTDVSVMLLTPESQDFILIPHSYRTGEVKLTPPVSKLLILALWLALTIPNCFS